MKRITPIFAIVGLSCAVALGLGVLGASECAHRSQTPAKLCMLNREWTESERQVLAKAYQGGLLNDTQKAALLDKGVRFSLESGASQPTLTQIDLTLQVEFPIALFFRPGFVGTQNFFLRTYEVRVDGTLASYAMVNIKSPGPLPLTQWPIEIGKLEAGRHNVEVNADVVLSTGVATSDIKGGILHSWDVHAKTQITVYE